MIRIGIVGVGKIARDQHIPAIAADTALELVAVASHGPADVGVPAFGSLEAMLEQGPDLDAIALCTPPQARRETARIALRAGKHVLLEKPPGATVGEVGDLSALAAKQGVTLFAAWHSRFAAGVPAARAWLTGRSIRSVDIQWREDVRHWHPGQGWIWEAGGLGVFDPGINALSILTEIMPQAVFVTGAHLQIPENVQSPSAAQLALSTLDGVTITADFDFLQTGPQTWDITVVADDGTLRLSHGGAVVEIDGKPVVQATAAEYPALYARFTQLIRSGRSEADSRPLALVADALLIGTRERVAAFIE
ncbi:Gfo/Idh/MocA family protein [Caulobacter henricii]|uniref:Galactose 1-dehydrogenase n=1 Tax=Caulobacter henricii TaxID=69395 RepID=A0A0P0P436_9CAUL|nr:Gfo/Idh/MocA family oxidoreductase [Caulobacter henricii]ALL15211.1 galactose 1-dehydrogenase [Caulobacter henricii]